jgi:multimeric flavodoxin WrbA
MKVVAINGSPRNGGNVSQCLDIMAKEFVREGIEFEVLQPGPRVHPCMACYHCLEKGTLHCVQNDDMVNEIIDKCIEADGIILASPVYHGAIAGSMKCVMDRVMLAAGCGENQFHHKVGAAFCTLRRSGGMETYQQLLGIMDAMEMVIVTSDYWGAVHGADPGEAMQDIEGTEVVAKLARNIAWMVKVIDAAKGKIDPPETHKRTFTNFIR